jgi:hypothetical protein
VDNCWYKAILVGLFSITAVRSKILSLKENRDLGLDGFYTRCRESCIDKLITATLVKRTKIITQNRERFLDDRSFTKDFGEIVLTKMKHSLEKEKMGRSKAEPAITKLQKEMNSLKELINTPAPDRETLSVIHEALIKSAILYISRREIKSILKNWSEHKKPEAKRAPWRASGGAIW